ncbi:BCCT family transporter [Desulforhopalus singaporensis]|uniref:Glycine betaine transporter n=1 Tax=Desulforhopalus singaporensis TaxID=91360 RepID=A0A1H0UR47_9BACT|nr:BCCT family transporter [Desulforhopalus singaporensis]SDP68595.1 glycine betaine transporter [Desulforhopalus singaporensis]
MQHQEPMKIDKTISIGSALICSFFIVATLISADTVKDVFSKIFNFFIANFGWAYLLVMAGFVVFSFVMAMTRFGKIRLGKDDEEPEFGILSWFAMLFAAGMGIGLVFWGVAEPMFHYSTPPYAEPKSAQAAADAMRIAFFHWGLHPWSGYVIVGLVMGYFQFRKDKPGLLSWTVEPLVGEKHVKGLLGKSIDCLAVVVTLFGVANSLGMGAMQVTTGLNKVYGIPNTTVVSIILIVIITVLFVVSAVTGVNKGIKWLSNINMVMAFGLMALILFCGPTNYILESLFEALGAYFQTIVKFSFFLDTTKVVEEHVGYDWMGSWTIFYWAWWLVWAPFVGAFIARISRGRTIREFVFGALLAPTLLCAIWFSILGGTALNLEMNMAQSPGIAAAALADAPAAIFQLYEYLPFTSLLSLVTMAIICIFFITSADSATYIVGVMSSGGDLNPKNALKVIWGALCSGVAIALLMTGGLKAVQTVSFIFSFPFMILMIFMAWSFLRSIKAEFQQ